MHRLRWTWLATLAGALLMTYACGGHAIIQATCDGGACGDGSGSGGGSGSSSGGVPFPFSGPSCTGPSFGPECWGCVHDMCQATESCLSSDCSGYFNCFCACAAGDTTCQSACQGALTPACQTCAESVTACQKQSCPSLCAMGSGMTQTICATPTSCSNGMSLVACSVVAGGLCQSQYYTVGSQTFTCAACGDCTAAANAAGAACP
jgi:hypothetical protein